MTDPALVVSQSGRPTDGVPALVAANGHDPVATLAVDRPEDGQYHLSPATLEQVEAHDVVGRESGTVVVDGTPHPGQLADLAARLRPTAVVDTRQVLWERLAGANPAAEVCLELRAARVERRHAADAQREGATQGPSGTSGRLADVEGRVQDLRGHLEERRARARRRVRTGHADADARVVVLGRVGAPTMALWAALTGETGASGVGRPARPTTATAAVGPHAVAVTDTPGVPGDEGLPGWLTRAVPGLTAALERATVVFGVGLGDDPLLAAVAERFDVHCRSLAAPDADAARAALGDRLETAAYAVRLPYGDDAHALVSDLHDRTVVHATEYDDAVYLRLEASLPAADELRRRVDAVGGEVTRLDERG
jgi:hypothetical protein